MSALIEKLNNLSQLQICLVVIWLLLQGAIITIFPEEVIMTTLGLLWGQGRIGFPLAMLAVIIGLCPANAWMVFVGQWLGPKVFYRRPFSWLFSKESVEGPMKFLRKFGPWAIVGARFTPSVRAPIYLAVGLSQFGVLNFMKFDFLAALVHVPLLIWLGAYIGRHSSSMEEAYKIIGIIAVTLILGGILLAQAVKYFRKRRAAKK